MLGSGKEAKGWSAEGWTIQAGNLSSRVDASASLAYVQGGRALRTAGGRARGGGFSNGGRDLDALAALPLRRAMRYTRRRAAREAAGRRRRT